MPDDGDKTPRARPFWSGTIAFGLVSVPVDLYAAVRPRRVSLRTLGPDGHPLARRYYCSEDGDALGADDIVRGHPTGGGGFVVVTDEELDELEPRKSREIDLRRFVPRDDIDPSSLDRTYVLAPAGDSTKAYHLLAEVMERGNRAGVATVVMRGKEYLVAIFSEGGVLRASTLRFADELRTPEDVGLPDVHRAEAKCRRAMAAALDALGEAELDESLLRDETADALIELAERKRAEGKDVVEVGDEVDTEETLGKVIDLMSVLRERLGQTPRTKRAPSERLSDKSKQELYEQAKALDIPGRSKMSKAELIEAIRAGG